MDEEDNIIYVDFSKKEKPEELPEPSLLVKEMRQTQRVITATSILSIGSALIILILLGLILLFT